MKCVCNSCVYPYPFTLYSLNVPILYYISLTYRYNLSYILYRACTHIRIRTDGLGYIRLALLPFPPSYPKPSTNDLFGQLYLSVNVNSLWLDEMKFIAIDSHSYVD